jgi:hypothetical protein
MNKPWALSALWVGLASIAKPLAPVFGTSTALPETLAGAGARIIGAHWGIGGFQASKQRNQFLFISVITQQGNSTARYNETAETAQIQD